MANASANDLYNIDHVVGHRRMGATDEAEEFLVQWEGYTEDCDQTWVARAHLESIEAGRRAIGEYEERRERGEVARSPREEASSVPERKVAYGIFASLQHRDVRPSTTNVVYSVLADALPVGKGRCQKEGKTH